MAEGLYLNGQLDKALTYYQSAYQELNETGETQNLKKIIKRILDISRRTDQNVLGKSYLKIFKKRWPSESVGIITENSPSKTSEKVAQKAVVVNSEKSRLKVKLLVYYSSTTPFEVIRRLTSDEVEELNSDKQGFIERLEIEAKQKFANDKGYSISVYGKKNYLMLSLYGVVYKIYDMDWGREIASNRRQVSFLPK